MKPTITTTKKKKTSSARLFIFNLRRRLTAWKISPRCTGFPCAIQLWNADTTDCVRGRRSTRQESDAGGRSGEKRLELWVQRRKKRGVCERREGRKELFLGWRRRNCMLQTPERWGRGEGSPSPIYFILLLYIYIFKIKVYPLKK